MKGQSCPLPVATFLLCCDGTSLLRDGKMEKRLTDERDGRYRTSDLYYAAFLKVAGVPFLETTQDAGRVFFIFDATGGVRDLKAQYFNRTAKVSALSYADEIKAMKVLTHMNGG